jgi:hypothetical protein
MLAIGETRCMELRTSHARRALAALVFTSALSVLAARANADATNKCTLFVQADAERALHGAVVYLPSELDPTDCAWALAKDSSVGVTVSRATPPLSPPHDGSYGVSHVRHVTGVGKDAYTYYANAGGGGLYTADVLTSKGVTSVTLTEKAGNAASALAIARTVMNR